jgi:hypothetical protein
MSEPAGALPLPVVDGRRLDKRFRDALDPGGFLADRNGRARQLPRYFYEVPSWTTALELEVTPNFKLWEFIHTDVREAEPLRSFPRYVPCAVTLLAVCLERFREAVGNYVHVAANGGYRSPRHRLTGNASPHCWAAAVDIYRVGDTYLDDRNAIERYASVAREALPGVWTQPYGQGPESTDDHLHLDLGYVVTIPRDAPGDAYIAKLDTDPI